MAENTKIEWCDSTFNPWEGCTKVSPGCANCYAENRNARFGGGTAVNWGKGAPRRRTSVQNWNQPVKWNAAAAAEQAVFNVPGVINSVMGPVERPRVFCASLADWLDDEVPVEWLADLLDLICLTPNLDWLLLSKRPENWRARLNEVNFLNVGGESPRIGRCSAMIQKWLNRNPPANVWIGTTVEDQVRADERIPALLSIPARVRFLSCEPLLGPVKIATNYWLTGQSRRQDKTLTPIGTYPRIDWVICGGESGPNARPMHPEWALSLRDQCEDAGVPFLFKQWGEWAPYASDRDSHLVNSGSAAAMNYGKHYLHLRPDGTDERTGKEATITVVRVGKHEAGRLLDGIDHNALPGGAK